tara:strand:- start:46 stop:1143 length:1098 start_codon:yes stop_codon:yes gene_type:complete
MALTKISTDGVKDDAVTLAKQAAGTDGQIITYDASGNPVAVGPGTDGQVLTSTGAGSPPAFETPAASPITALNNATANELVTVGSTTTELDAEANLTFDGSQLFVETNGNSDPIVANSTYANKKVVIRETSDANSNGGIVIQKKHSALHPNGYWYGDIRFEGWDGDEYRRAAVIECVAEGTPANDNMPGGLRFHTNPGQASQVERLRITKDGDVQVKSGNLVIETAGKGIDFSATSDASGKTSELLDDYEEGTWTPTTPIGAMTTVHSGYYTKIGRMVTVQAYVTMPTSSSSTTSIISGFPFTALGSGHYAIGAAYCSFVGNHHFFMQMSPGTASAHPHYGIGHGITYATASGGYVLFSLTYYTS